MNAQLNTPEGARLDTLVTLVEAWEAKHYPLDLSNETRGAPEDLLHQRGAGSFLEAGRARPGRRAAARDPLWQGSRRHCLGAGMASTLALHRRSAP
jgi:hypothetical protein